MKHINPVASISASLAILAIISGCSPSSNEEQGIAPFSPSVTEVPTDPAAGNSSDNQASPAYEKVIETLQGLAGQVGGTLGESFDAGGNITGHVVKITDNDLRIAYSTADGSRLILGTLLDADGTNLTDAHIEDRLPKIDLEGTFGELEKLSLATLVTGKVPSTMRVIYDPLCGFCKELYRTMSEKDLQVHWHPVAIMGPDAVSISAGMIAGRDKPEAVMSKAQTDEGRAELSTIGQSNDAARTATDLNWALASKTRVNGTPAVYWKLADGTVKIVRGRPSPEELATIIEQATIN